MRFICINIMNMQINNAFVFLYIRAANRVLARVQSLAIKLKTSYYVPDTYEY